MPAVLALREYERATIGDRWDPERRVVTSRTAAAMEALQADQRAEIVSIGRRAIQAQQWIGTVGLGEQALELLPKIDRTDAPAVRQKLMSMLAVGGLVPHLESGEVAIAASRETLLDSYLDLYVRRLTREWRRGPIRDYRRETRERDYLRGKLEVAEQMRATVRRPHRFVTSADELTLDAPLSRLLKSALLLCHRHAVSQAVRQQARMLLGDFNAVGELAPNRDDPEAIGCDRRQARFESLAALARLLLRCRAPDRPGSDKTFSLVFDMNVVFERFIAAEMARVCTELGLRAAAQVSGRSLLLQSGRPKFALRPDIVISQRGELQCVIDTKWKRLDRSLPHAGVSQADMYQMYAYGKEYRCDRVVVLYPRHGDLPAHVASYQHVPGDASSPVIEIRTIDIRAERPSILGELRAIVQGGEASGPRQ